MCNTQSRDLERFLESRKTQRGSPDRVIPFPDCVCAGHDAAAVTMISLFPIKSRVPRLDQLVIDLHAAKIDIAQPSTVLVFHVLVRLDSDS